MFVIDGLSFFMKKMLQGIENIFYLFIDMIYCRSSLSNQLNLYMIYRDWYFFMTFIIK